MSSLAIELARLLGGIQRPGDYCTAGTREIFAPGLEVEGVGPIALPLLPAQAEQLVAAAERAPFGRGEQTLVDTDVRRTWQINKDKVQIRGRNWARTLAGILTRAADGLGVDRAGHRRTLQAPRLRRGQLLCEPSRYRESAWHVRHAGHRAALHQTGGALVVRHQDREARLDLRCHDPSEVAFAAFYADCQHEVLPVTSGCRLTLIYNLLRGEPGDLPRPPSYDAERGRLADLLQAGPTDGSPADGIAPEKLIYPLEHAYTPAGLAFGALKGADAARAAVLAAAASGRLRLAPGIALDR